MKTVDRELGEIQAKLESMHLDILELKGINEKVQGIEQQISKAKGVAAGIAFLVGGISSVLTKLLSGGHL